MGERDDGVVSCVYVRASASVGGLAGIDGDSVCTNYEYSDDINIKIVVS